MRDANDLLGGYRPGPKGFVRGNLVPPREWRGYQLAVATLLRSSRFSTAQLLSADRILLVDEKRRVLPSKHFAIANIICHQCDSHLKVAYQTDGDAVGAYCASCVEEWPLAYFDSRTRSLLRTAARDSANQSSGSPSMPSRTGVGASKTPTPSRRQQKPKPTSSRITQPNALPNPTRSRRSIKITQRALDRRTGRSLQGPAPENRRMIRGVDYVTCSKCRRRFNGEYLTAEENYIVHVCYCQPVQEAWRDDK